MKMTFFKSEHLPPYLKPISKDVGDLAIKMNEILEDGPEKAAGLRKLLEAKDCFLRAELKE